MCDNHSRKKKKIRCDKQGPIAKFETNRETFFVFEENVGYSIWKPLQTLDLQAQNYLNEKHVKKYANQIVMVIERLHCLDLTCG